MGLIFGQPRKAGKARRDRPSGPVRGPVIAPRTRMAQVVVRDAEPIGTRMMRTLAFAIATGSPMSNGNGGNITNNIGFGVVGRFTGRTGNMQDWRVQAQPMATPSKRNVGMQGGAGAQAAYPSTGSNALPSIMNQLKTAGGR